MKPKLVLHICCAPDEAWVIHSLRESWELYSFFCNPNIQPKDEYEKREAEARRVAAMYDIPFEADTYDEGSWEEAIRGLESTGEGGERCERCFLLRLGRTAAFCRRIGWERFTTVMSISPHKRIEQLTATGHAAAQEHGVVYEPFNFKKKNGFLNSIALSNELGLYRQDYCGCRLSRQERDRRNASRRG
jgi:hypothetical protein